MVENSTMTSNESFISIKGVTKSFGSLRAVDNVSFDVRRGEFFSLLGPSGCGKTTLLRMLAGFEHPSEGNINIDGVPMSGVPASQRPTNMVFQNYAIFPHLDVRKNIAYGLIHRKMSKEEIDRAVDGALAMIKMPEYGHRRAHQLSGGQRQRVALARALVCQPKVLLLDEPLGALDKKLREEMQLELRQLQRSVGITFIFVTHDQEEALTMSDRIAVMSKGDVLQIDTANNLYESPNCKEVAGFIGNMNFFEGKLLSDSAGQAIIDAGHFGTLRVVNGENPLAAGRPVTLAVRPEKIALSDKPLQDASENVVKGKVVAQSYLGDRNHYYVQVNGAAAPIAIAAQNVSRDRSVAAEGREVWIRWKVDAGVLLADGRNA